MRVVHVVYIILPTRHIHTLPFSTVNIHMCCDGKRGGEVGFSASLLSDVNTRKSSLEGISYARKE